MHFLNPDVNAKNDKIINNKYKKMKLKFHENILTNPMGRRKIPRIFLDNLLILAL